MRPDGIPGRAEVLVMIGKLYIWSKGKGTTCSLRGLGPGEHHARAECNATVLKENMTRGADRKLRTPLREPRLLQVDDAT